MNKNEMLKLKRKVEKYEKLEEKVGDICDILNFPKNIRDKHGENSQIRVELDFSYGTRRLEFMTNNNDELGKVIFNALIEEKARLQKEMEEL